MTIKSWVLTDVERDVYVEKLELLPQEVGGPAEGYAVRKRRLYGGPRDGVDLVEIEVDTDEGPFRLAIVPTRGMGIWRGKLADVRLGWQSPVHGPVHPSLVNLHEASGLGWLQGFDEMLVRCGLENNGGPSFDQNGNLQNTLHGKLANIPAHLVELSIDTATGVIQLTGQVDESRLFHSKLRLTTTYTFRINHPGVEIVDQIENLSAEPGELELLYHINMGVPLLEPGAKLVIPFETMAPHNQNAVENLPEWDTYGPESPGKPEACFFFEPAADADGKTRVLLHNQAGDRGFGIRFNKNQLPRLIQWKQQQSIADGYVTGIEPAINFPNPKPFEKAHGRVASLEPGEKRTFELYLEAFATAETIATAREEIEKLQATAAGEVQEKPNPDWSQG